MATVTTASSARSTSKLDARLNELIAKRDGIRPEEVTVKYIHDQRVTKLYRNARYAIGSNLGGYSTVGLAVRSLAEFEEREARVDEFLRHFI